jgi:hypothetical protein
VPPKAALTEVLSATMGHLSGKGRILCLATPFFFSCSASEAFGFLMWYQSSRHTISPAVLAYEALRLWEAKGLLLVEALSAPSRAFKSR